MRSVEVDDGGAVLIGSPNVGKSDLDDCLFLLWLRGGLAPRFLGEELSMIE